VRRAPVWLAAGLAAVLAASGARAQDARLTTRLEPATRTAVERIIDSARVRGLPAEPLTSKALEGASKGAAGDRIVAAVRALAADLAEAREALGPEATPAELSTAASALRAGVTPATLRQLRRSRGHGPVAAHLAVLVDFIARGVPVDSASASMLVLARSPLGDDVLFDVRRLVERDIALGTPPASAAAVRTNTALQMADRLNNNTNLTPTPQPERRRP
jgi:hypothetical protein